MRIVFRLLFAIVVASLVVAATVVLISPHLRDIAAANTSEDEDIDLSRLDDYAIRSFMYASDGSILETLRFNENREPVELNVVPETVKESILSVEDADFYVHAGINLKANVRAMLENVQAGGIEQGGSTITQQLVKNALLNSEQSFGRKSQEAAMAIRLEQKLAGIAEDEGKPDPTRAAKDLILEKYLNTVYFGAGAYGVQAAAQTYWGKDVKDLGWAEGAMLAAIISNPVGYDPTQHPDRARKQRQIALDRSAQLDKITTEQAEQFGQAPLPTSRCVKGSTTATNCGDEMLIDNETYFGNAVKDEILNPKNQHYEQFKALGATPAERRKNLLEGGLRIHTTFDPQAQMAAEYAVGGLVPPEAREANVTAGLVSVEPNTGAVRVMVDGRPVTTNKFNVTWDGRRQIGSTFKTFTLLTALQQGNSREDYIGGEGGDIFLHKNEALKPGEVCPLNMPKEEQGEWFCPRSDDNRIGNGSLTYVTEKSINPAYVRLSQVVGRQNVKGLAESFGLTGVQDVPSMTLGVNEQRPIDMAAAYAAIANTGEQNPYYLIDRIEDRSGKVLFEHTAMPARRVSADVACVATEILVDNVLRGTGVNAKLPKQPAAGKTGTTDRSANLWFVGYTPYLTTAVWMGDPDPQKANAENPWIKAQGGELFGGGFPAKIWESFNEPYHANRTVVPFPACKPIDHPVRNVIGLGKNELNTMAIAFGGNPPAAPSAPIPTLTTTKPGTPPQEPNKPAPVPTTVAPPPAPPPTTAPRPTFPTIPIPTIPLTRPTTTKKNPNDPTPG